MGGFYGKKEEKKYCSAHSVFFAIVKIGQELVGRQIMSGRKGSEKRRASQAGLTKIWS